MTREEIKQGLQFTIDMFLFEPTTGETLTEPRNDMDKTTIDACRGAIKLLEAWDKVIKEIEESKESVVGRYDVNTPELERPYAKTMRNNGRKEALEIIKKHLGEVEE